MRLIVNHTGWKRILFLVLPYIFIVGIFELIGALISGIDISNIETAKTPTQELVLLSFDFIGTFIVLWLFMKYVDNEKFTHLGFQIKNRLWDFIIGIGLGLIIMLLGYLLLFAIGEITFKGIDFNLFEFIYTILLFSLVSIAEEALTRGYILRNLMISFNKYFALILSSIIFSLMHIFNPNIDILAICVIFLSGILLGLSYIYTKNLWFPIGLHFSWNFFQNHFGFNVSGKDLYSLIEISLTDKNILNGGGFGFEGSILSIILTITFIILIERYYRKLSQKQSKLNYEKN